MIGKEKSLITCVSTLGAALSQFPTPSEQGNASSPVERLTINRAIREEKAGPSRLQRDHPRKPVVMASESKGPGEASSRATSRRGVVA